MTTSRKFVVVVIGLLACICSAQAATTLWEGPGSKFEDSPNWTAGTPGPAVSGVFSSSGPTNLTLALSTVTLGLIYNSDAPSYTTTISNGGLVVGAGGIQNLSTRLQTIVVSSTAPLTIDGSISGNVQLTHNGSSVLWVQGPGALSGNVKVVNASTGTVAAGELFFATSILHAGTAVFDNNGGGTLELLHGFRGDSSTLHNNNGLLALYSDADMSSMTVVNASTMTLLYVGVSSVTVGSLSGSGKVDLSNKIIAIGGTSADSAISGVVSGAGGSVIKVGTGTLILSGANTYSSGTTVMNGALQVNTTSLAGNATNYASLIFDQAFDGTYAGLLTGTGTLTKQGTGQVTISRTNLLSGGVDVAQGTLNVTGALPGAMLVEENGLVIGTGNVGAVTNQGTLQPGASGSGSLTVASYSGPGTLNIPFNGATHPILGVTGTATLSGGRLQLSGSQFSPGVYVVLQAGAVNGTFTSVSAPPFLNYQTLYAPTLLQVAVQSYRFGNGTGTGNQSAVANALDAEGSPAGGGTTPMTGPAAAALKAIAQLPTADVVHQAFSQLSGDALTSFYDVGLRPGRLFTDGLTERPVPMDSAAPTTVAQAPVQLALNGDAKGLGTGVKASPKRRGLWGRVIGAFATTKADGSNGSPQSTANTGGFQVGYDLAPTEMSQLGLFIGYARTGISVDDRASTGHTNATGIGLYGRYAPGAWFFDSTLAYTSNSNTMDRTLSFANQTAHASFTSPLVTLYGDAGYAFEPKPDTALEPYLALRISHLSQNSFTESGAPGEDLSVDNKSVNSAVPMLAARATHLFHPESRHPFMLSGNLGLEYEMGTVSRDLTARFADGSGPSFTVNGTPQKRVAADLALGGRIALSERWQAYANYALTVASQHFAQGLMGGARLTW